MPQTLSFIFPTQVKISTLMSSLTSEANSPHSDAERCIFIFEAAEQTDTAAFFGAGFDEKVGEQMQQRDLTLSKSTGLSAWSFVRDDNDEAGFIT